MPVLRRSEFRILFFVVIGLVAVGVAAALAFARGKPIGTGVVVIDTNLGYQGGAAAGSGMVLTSSGTVLTNNHVIAGATTIKVVVPNSRHSYIARVVGYDRTKDVAVLRLQGASNLKTISVNSSNAAVGEVVRAVGNAGGTGNFTSARGTVTGLNRSIVASDEQGSTEQLTGLIETNAVVQPGDSGGPLLDSAGRVVGMDTAASASSSFASEGVRRVCNPDRDGARDRQGHRRRQGVRDGARRRHCVSRRRGAAANDDPYGYGGYGYAGTAGALIAGVVPGGPAASAGLSAGD